MAWAGPRKSQQLGRAGHGTVWAATGKSQQPEPAARIFERRLRNSQELGRPGHVIPWTATGKLHQPNRT
eukprot:1683352-Pyramimonas_sp.AAC.1